MEDLRTLSLNDLIKRLHESLVSFLAGMENVVSMNRRPPNDDIPELRSHIIERLKKGEEVADNKKIISLLDLLSKDQAVLDLVKDDAKDWLEILETIESHVGSKTPLSAVETTEIRKIR